ncbi:type VI secretion system protein TssA [Oleomonas cavernae]|uniref:Type VI secretion system protein TssA n=1 Tax=Oleomonas cavernae TaxID=2320859 RepID=A0A418WE66_9PROT|nr:type VI secretion system protein TssA [Oleomonas cavernae]RJF88313.1 type VI secretion system protein TssA [Oleomonas cavernae]
MEALPDLGAMLVPIEGEAPSGVDLRADESPTAPIRNLRDARKTATQAERRREGLDESEVETGLVPEWKIILDQVPNLIATKSKDLELAAWLSEALLRANGLPGLAHGFRLISGLVTSFWPATFPPAEDGDQYEMVRPIAQLNGESAEGTLFAPLRRLTITKASTGISYAVWQHENAFALAQKPAEIRDKRIAEGALTIETIEQSGNATPVAFFLDLIAGTTEALAAVAELDTILTEKAGSAAPSFSRLREFLQQLQETTRSLGRNVLPPPPAETGDAGTQAGGEAAVGAGGGGGFSLASGDALKNREAALGALQQIADFFRRTEPHSVLSYTLQDAVRRARLSLPELMAELLSDDSVRKQFFAHAGFKLPDPSGDGSSSY